MILKLGDLIKAKRLSDGLSLREFAEKCNLSHSYIKNLELSDPRTGKDVVPTIESLEKISAALGMSLIDLLREAGYVEEDHRNFEPSNLKLIRKNRTYEEISRDILEITGEKVDPAVYEAIEKGQVDNITLLFIHTLSKYADVDPSFFYIKNLVHTPDSRNRNREIQAYSSANPLENIAHLDENNLREFVTNPENKEYLKLAKELCDRRIKVKLIRSMLFED